MAPETNGTQRDIGVLIGKVDDIVRRLGEADTSRARMHEHINSMSNDVATIKTEVAGVRSDIDEMKPEVEMVKHLKSKAAGAILVLGSLGAMIGWLLSTFSVSIKTFVIRAFGG